MNQPEKQCFYVIATQQIENFFQGNIAIFMCVFIFFITQRYKKWASKSAYAEYDAHFLNYFFDDYLKKPKIPPILSTALSMSYISIFLLLHRVYRKAQFKYG